MVMDRYIAAYDDDVESANYIGDNATSGIVLHPRSSRNNRRQSFKQLSSSRKGRSSTPRSLTPRRLVDSRQDQTPSQSRRQTSSTRNRSPSPTQVMGIPGLNCDEDDQGEEWSESVEPDEVEVGMCLFTDLKSANSWNKKFIWVQLLSGITVALHQVPECVSYAFIAGVDPFHALQAAWIANLFTPIVGGTPGLVSGPSGLGAIAIRFLVSAHGPGYMFYSLILCGFCQVLFEGLGFGKYLRLLPTGITIGMVNALCVLLMALQLRYFKSYPSITVFTDIANNSTAEVVDSYVEPTRYLEATFTEDTLNQPWAFFLGYDLPWDATTSQVIIVSGEAFVAMLICYFSPKTITIVPSSLMAIVLLTGVNSVIRMARSDWVAPTVGDYFAWEAPKSKLFMGMFHPDYNLPPLFNLNTLSAVTPAGLSLFCINLLETMVAINVADKYTSVVSDQDRVFYGQGVGNILSGLMAGMGGTGLSHTSLLGLGIGGVTTLSVFFAGIIMFCLVTFVYPVVAVIPLGAFMGTTLHLMLTMIQKAPLLALVLNCVPCLKRLPCFVSKRLVVADLFSTLVTSMIVILASTYGLVGYFIGFVCYACDPIAHAALLDEGGSEYSFVELKLSVQAAKPKWKKEQEETNARTTDDLNTRDDVEES